MTIHVALAAHSNTPLHQQSSTTASVRRGMMPRTAGLFVAALAVLFAASADAQLYWDTNGVTAGSDNSTSFTWNSTVSGNTWNTSSLGTGSLVTQADEAVVFSAGTNATGTNTINLANAETTAGMTFEEGVLTFGGTGGTQSLTLGSGGITMVTGLNGNVTFNNTLGIVLSASQTWANNTLTATGPPATTLRNLTVNSAITSSATAGTYVLTIGGTSTGTTALAGVISDGGVGATVGLAKSGAGTLTLSGSPNTFTGGVNLSSGTVNLNKATALGAAGSVFTISGASTIATTAANTTLVNYAQNWNSNFSFGGTDNLNMGAGAVTINASRTVSIAGTGTYTVDGAISGTGFSLTTANTSTAVSPILTGKLVLNGANSYTGGTNINGGLVQFGTGAIPTTGTITVGQRGALAVAGAYTTLAGWLGESKLSVLSTGALALTGDSSEAFTPATYTTLSLGAAVGTTVNYTGTITPGAPGYYIGGGGGTLTFGNANTLTGANNVTVGNGGGGTVLLTTANNYTGTTTVAGGFLTVQNDNALGAGGAGNGTVVTGGSVLQLQGGVNVTNESLIINGVGSGDARPNGLNNVSGSNTWNGNITSNNNGNYRIISSAGTLTIAGNITTSGTYALDSVAGTGIVLVGAGNINVTGKITGAMTVITTTTGTVTLSDANDFTGGFRMQTGGTVVVTSINSLNGAGTGSVLASSGLGAPTSAASAQIVFGANTTSATSGVLRYEGTGETTNRGLHLIGIAGTATLNQSGTGLLKFEGAFTHGSAPAAKTLAITGSTAGTGEIASVITNSNASNFTSVTKTGTGLWNLSGNNTYSGISTVSNGTLLVNGNHTAAGNYVVTATGAKLGGGGSITGRSAATIGLGANSFLMVGNTHGAGATNQLAGVDFDLTTVGGAITLAGTMQFDVFTDAADFDRLDLSTSAGGSLILTNGMVELALGQDTDTSSWLAEGRIWQLIDWNGLTATTTGLGLTASTIAAFQSAGFTLTQSIINDGAGGGVDGFYVTIGAVPEPSRMLLVLAGLSIACLRRRRGV